MAEKESFVFYASFYEALQDMKDKDRLKVYDAICELALNNKETELTGLAKIVFTLIKPQILANQKRYENGRKGGRPKKTTDGLLKEITNGFENKKTDGFNKTKTKTKPNENENVNVNDNDNDNVGDSCVDGLQEVIDFYSNNIGFLNPYGLKILESYVEDMSSELVIYAMQIAVENNKKTISYIKAILNNWSKANIMTLEEAKRENKKKVSSNKQIEQRKYTEDEFESLYVNGG